MKLEKKPVAPYRHNAFICLLFGMKTKEYTELLKLSLDIHFLRNLLVPGLDLCTGTSWKKNRQDLREVAALHGAKLRVCRKCSDDTVDATYEDALRLITVISSHPTKNELIPLDILYTFTHELAHALQFGLIRDVPAVQHAKFFGKFKNAIRLEQVAESLAYFVALNYFPTLSGIHSLKRENFSTYFNKTDLLFIASRGGFDLESEEVLTEISNLEDL